MIIARFWMGYKIYLASLKSILMAVSLVRGTILMSFNIILKKVHIAYLHDIKFHSFNTHL